MQFSRHKDLTGTSMEVQVSIFKMPLPACAAFWRKMYIVCVLYIDGSIATIFLSGVPTYDGGVVGWLKEKTARFKKSISTALFFVHIHRLTFALLTFNNYSSISLFTSHHRLGGSALAASPMQVRHRGRRGRGLAHHSTTVATPQLFGHPRVLAPP